MADTYAWVEHHCASIDSRGKKTEKWVLEQQIFYSCSTPPGAGIYDGEAQGWTKNEGTTRRSAVRTRETEKARIIEEELKRIESRIRQRREMEKQRVAAERSRSLARMKQRERDEEEQIRDAWRAYEKGWEDLVKPLDQITFSTLPWPLASPPKTLEDITLTRIRGFILSPLHSENQTSKERMRRAQLRWHPDRFRRILAKVESTDKTAIEAGAGVVARCLNEIMAQKT